MSVCFICIHITVWTKWQFLYSFWWAVSHRWQLQCWVSIKSKRGRRPWALSQSRGSGCRIVVLGLDLLPCLVRQLQYGATVRLHREPRSSTRATWSRSVFPPATRSADTMTCREAWRQTCLQAHHRQLRQTPICPHAGEVSTSDVCREHVPKMNFCYYLLTLHNGREKKFNPACVRYFVCLPSHCPGHNERALEFQGP